MPANSSIFNKYLCILLLASTGCSPISRQLPELTDEQHAWIGEKVFANECGGQFSCLTSWNSGENFPSLGIGHFIWYQAGQTEIYSESFPALLEYYQTLGVSLPLWLNSVSLADSPWQSREEFYAEIDDGRLSELRSFLHSTMPVQAAFIVQRLQGTLPLLLANSRSNQHTDIENLFYRIANTEPPFGIYALIDYVHFKGEGNSLTERYQGQGWGLLQVLEAMLAAPQQGSVLQQFSAAASVVLERRVSNAPPERDEGKWLQGWRNRVAGYIPES
jgi:hypothetical protein